MGNDLNSNRKGAIAEAEITAAAVRLGYMVLRPTTDGLRYDLAIDDGTNLVRLQCKWAQRKGDVVAVYARTSRLTPAGYVHTVYSSSEIDAVAAYCAELDTCYLIPADVIDGRGMVHLRLEPAKNGQRGAVTMAAEYEFGAVAQLEERRHGMAEARGSSPLSSIPPEETVIGAHEFRNRFGWYAERAAAGEQILVTRRGKPHLRLSPPG